MPNHSDAIAAIGALLDEQGGTADPSSRPTAQRDLFVLRLGVVPYTEALAFQREVARARISGAIDQDVLILVEHPPVVTLGRASKERHLVSSPEFLAQRGVELHEVERGGDVTFHGPGQLVGYPIIDLKRHRQDLHWYLRQVEEVLIDGLAEFGIPAGRNVGYTGVWTNGRKIASIGVHARDWVTWHGFALNVTTDLSYFNLIVPCGIAGVDMTSVARELGERGDWTAALADGTAAILPPNPDADTSLMPGVERAVIQAFGRVFSLEPSDVEREEIERRMAATAHA